MEEIGVSQEARMQLQQLLELQSGLCVIAGATGAGKTTTLYALLQELIHRNKRVITVEDPVEAILPGITQIQVNLQRGITFQQSIKGMLRQDPDVIVLGELRDGAVAQEAILAATSGHLVLATIHGGSINDVLARLEGWCPTLQVKQVLKAVVHQTLKTLPNGERLPIMNFFAQGTGKKTRKQNKSKDELESS